MRRRRWLWIILFATPVLLLAADTLYWWIAIRNLESGFAAWEVQLRAAGWTDQHGPTARGGWPLAAVLGVPAMSLSGLSPETKGQLAWSAEKVALQVALARPAVLEIMPTGQQRFRSDDYAEVPFTAELLRLDLPLETAAWPSFSDLVAHGLHAQTPLGEADLRELSLHLDFRPQAQSGEPALGYTLKAAGITLPPGVVRPLGPQVATLEIEGVVNGPVPVGRTMAEQAAAWRDGGGSIDIQHLAMAWGPLDLSGSATLALDDQLQPMGTGTARLVGYAEALDALAAHAAISRSAAIASKAVLSLLAHNPEDGSPPDVEVPLTLQYRTLSMRQVPLVRLPEVDWP
jgi:hypothetical protein